MIFLVRLYSERDGPKTRAEILNAVATTPGLTKSQLCRKIGLAWSTISHHIRVLESDGRLMRREIHGWTRMYVSSTPTLEMELMPLLRDNFIPQLLQELERRPGIGIQTLSATFGISRKVIRRQLNALVSAGAVSKTATYRPKYFVAERVNGVPMFTRPDLKGEATVISLENQLSINER